MTGQLSGKFVEPTWVSYDTATLTFKTLHSQMSGGDVSPNVPLAPFSLNKLQTLMRDFTYKPSWNFSIYPYDHLSYLNVGFYAPDSVKSFRYITPEREDNSSRSFLPRQEVIKIFASFPVPPIYNEGYFWGWLRDRIREVEQHETDEWFKIKGKPPYDPHAK